MACRYAVLGLIALPVVLPGLVGCAATSAEVKAARSAAYGGTFDEVWEQVQDGLSEDFSMAHEVDREHRRIVSCWRAIDRKVDNVNAGNINADRLFYRAIVQVSDGPPYRISVSGRAARFTQPQIIPFKHDDAAEPPWVEARTDRVAINIHKRLAGKEIDAPGAAPQVADPEAVENLAGSCIVGDLTGLLVNYAKGFPLGRRPAGEPTAVPR